MRLMRHRLLAATAIFALVPTGAALATTPDPTTSDTIPSGSGPSDSAPPDSTDVGGPASSVAGPSDGGSGPTATTVAPEPVVVTIYDGDRMAVGSVEALDSELSWTGYGEDDAPDEGNQYVRATVLVSSQRTDDDTFSINVDHFVLQDEHGFLTRGENVRTAAQVAADEDVPGDADLATGEWIELTITFEIPAGVEPLAVFYLNDDRLYEIVDLTPGDATTDAAGTEPDGTEPTGSEPDGTEPTGSEPDGSEPTGTEPSDG